MSELRDRICGLDLANQSPEEQLIISVAEILRAYRGMDHEHQIQTGNLSALPPEQQTVLRNYQRDLVRFISGIIRAAAPNSFQDDRAKLHATTVSVFGMLNWFYMWNGNASLTEREKYATLVSELVLHGVAGTSKAPH